MSTYRMDDGTVVKTENATATWEENTRWDGNNHISVTTGSQWEHQTLYRSRRGRYYLVHTSNWQGSAPHAEWISKRAAAAWLMANDHDVPDDLADEADAITE